MGLLVKPQGPEQQQCPQAYFLGVSIMFQPEQVLQHLNQGQWSGVKHLDLSSSQIDATAIKHMRTGAWPQLQVLDLSRNNIDEDALMQLEHRAWSSLESVILNRNPLTATAIARIPDRFGQAAIQRLSLAGVQLCSAGAASLTTLHCSLTALDLSSTGISASALSQLLSSPWPLLQHLDLHHNALAADAVAVPLRTYRTFCAWRSATTSLMQLQ